MRIVSLNGECVYRVDQVTFKKGAFFEGCMNCSDMVEYPKEEIYLFEPFRLKIKIKQFESKHPHFDVLETNSQSEYSV